MLAVMFSILIQQVFAISIGITPGRVRFDEVLQGGYSERIVTVSTNTDDILEGHLAVSGDLQEWVRFEPENLTFRISKSNPYRVKIIVEPPSDLRLGNYSGSIDFITDSISSVDGRAGGIVKAAVTLLMNAEVTGEENIECRAGAFNLQDIERPFPLEIGATVYNDGNVRIRPTIEIDIWDQFQETLLLSKEIISDQILPTTENKLREQMEHTLEPGQYWAKVGVRECNVDQLLTFNVVEEGDIIDRGIFSGIVNPPEVKVGETVEFLAKFENQGPRRVLAKFKGSIRIDETIVKLIETEEISVDSGKINDFPIFFTPTNEGRYVLSGRIIYNKKVTFEKSSVLNVDLADGEKRFSWLPLIIYLAIIITILFLFRKIRKERKKQHE